MPSFELLLRDGVPLLLSLGGLSGLIVLGEALRAAGVSGATTRRLIHAGVSLFVVVTPHLFSDPLPVYVLAALFVVVNAAARWNGWWGGIHEARPDSWGTVALPLAVVPSLAATWSMTDARVPILQVAFLVLAVSDPLASIVGQAYGRRALIADATWSGSGAFFGSAGLLTAAGLCLGTDWSLAAVGAASVLVAGIAGLVEAVSRRGWDNFFVVLAVVLVLVPLHAGTTAPTDLAVGLGVGIVFGGLAWWTRSLDTVGAVGGGLFAASLVGLGGWGWAVPAFVFFILSSALSRLPANGDVLDANTAWDGRGRTIGQVLANGGIAWALLGVWRVLPPGSEAGAGLFYVAFVGALAAAAADTWATEIGSRLTERPMLLRTFRLVAAGTSGAVSLAGTIAGLFGAASVAGAALIAPDPPESWVWLGAVSGLVGGFVGMAVDSIAGATVEGMYRRSDATPVGRGSALERAPIRGYGWIDNEVVNVMGTSAGAAAAVLMWTLAG